MANVREVVDAALATSNAVLWQDVANQLEPRERARMHDVLRDMKKRGLAWRRVSLDSEGNTVLHIVKGRHPNMPAGG